MRWDEESNDMSHSQRAFRPVVMDVVVGPAKRFRHPAVQAEIERRITIYTSQVEQTGRITWLPMRGKGRSA
jgi:hypothetical protein